MATKKQTPMTTTNGKSHALPTLPKRGDRVKFVTTGRNGRMPPRTGKVTAKLEATNGQWFEVRPDDPNGNARSSEATVKVRAKNLQVIA